MMSGHLVLLGDSIFDNGVYVPSGPSVIQHVQRLLAGGWRATLVAVDGATISSIERQLERIPADATHLVLSVGGNDVLGKSSFILSEPTHSYAAALTGLATIRDEFAREYRQMLADVRRRELPLAVCTIYDAVPVLSPAETAGLAIFNDVITRQAFAAGATLIDLRLVCQEKSDYAGISPIEPSATGGAKIARAIVAALQDIDRACRVVV
jgi:lysophospholipase L1-like esterase